MKKTVAVFISLSVFLLLGQAAFAGDLFGATPTPTPFAQDEAPDSFSSVIVYGLDANMGMGEIYFNFTDGVPSLPSYEFDIETEGAGTIHVTREYSLIYSRSDYLAGESIFIMGSFSETSVTENGERSATGRVSGQLMRFDSSAPDPSLVGKTLIMLAHYVESVEGVEAPDELSYYVLFLEPLDWHFGETRTDSASPEIHATPTPNTGGGLFATPGHTDSYHTDEPYSGGSEEDHHHDSGSSGSSSRSARHSSSSDMPEASGPIQVAVGTILVSVLAALSNLPSSAIGSGMGAFASSAGPAGSAGNAASSVSQGTVQPAASAAPSAGGGATSSSGAVGAAPVSGGTASPSGGGVSDILSSIGDFLRELISNLRDMLTDEGRSYASGRMSDLFEDEE